MKTYLHRLAALLILMISGALTVEAQFCMPTVPTFTVDLTGNPDSTWISPPSTRIDQCCGVTAPDKCVQFIVTLDPGANSITMDIPEGAGCGAKPPGALFYQVNCGPQIAIGTPVCVVGVGPHVITFCKPGNNANCYAITSIPAPDASGDAIASDGCGALLGTVGYNLASITWQAVPANPLYDTFLSCTTGCDTVTVTRGPGAPAFVDYQVCGFPLGSCAVAMVCDTMRVSFVSDLSVQIQPDSPAVCFGAPATTLTANVTGGAAPYTYTWSTGGSPVGGNSPNLSVLPGTFIVQVDDTTGCIRASDTVTVVSFAIPIDAQAGADANICPGDGYTLNGQIFAALGGVWSGGTGTFVPGATTLNAQYFPSAGEIAAGFVDLQLNTTGNFSCPGDSDVVRINIIPKPVPVITGLASICEFNSATYSTPNVVGNTYNWVVSGGTISSGQGTNSINVNWGAAIAGSVTVTETNPTGCDSTVTLAVAVNPKPDPVITGPNTICEFEAGAYSVIPVAGSTYVWAASGGNITLGQGTPNAIIEWGAAGIGQVSITQTNSFGCDTTVTFAVTINPKPVPMIFGVVAPCAWTTETYAAPSTPGSTYNWTVSGGSIASGQGTASINVNWGAAGAGQVSLAETNSFGCDSVATIVIGITPRPVAAIVGPATVCELTGGNAYSSAANVGATYTWSVTGGSIASGQGTTGISVNWGLAGAGTVSLLVDLPSGCDTTVSLNVIINPKPTPVIAGNTSVCAFTAENYSTPAVLGHTYNWSVGGGAITAGQGTNAITVQWGAAGAGSVSVTQTSAAGCDSTVNVAVLINPTPQPVISGPVAVCEFTSGNAYSTPAVAANTYLWSVSGGTISSGQGTNAISVFWGAAGAGSVSVTQTNMAGCDTTVTINVTIGPKPNPVIAGPISVCQYDVDNYSVTAVAGDTYNWAVSGGSISGGQGTNNVTVQWGAAGAGTVSVTQTTPAGCDTTVTVNVTINPKPLPVIAGPPTVCQFDAATYSVPVVAGNTYNWSVSGGAIAGGQGTSSINVNWGAQGAGSVTLTQTNAFGCDTTVTLPVTITLIPTAAIVGPAPVCELSGESYSSAINLGATYTWAVTGGNIASGQGTNAINVNWGLAGAGTITLNVALPSGCDTTVSLNVLINPKPTPVIGGNTSVCAFTAEAYSTPAVAGHSYSWSVGGGAITAGQGTNAIAVQWGAAGAGSVSVTQTSAAGCDSTVNLAVLINPTPQPVISGPVAVCEFTSGNAYSTPALPANTYLWSVSGGTISSGQGTNAISVFWGAAGAGTVSVTQTNIAGCDTTVTINVTIDPKPNPVIAGPITVCQYDVDNYSVTAVAGDTYNWSVSGGSISGGQGTNNVTVQWGAAGAGTVSVTQTTPAGCDTTVTVNVTINPKPLPVIAGPATVCQFESATYSVPVVAGNTYNWSVSGGAISGGQGTSSINVNWGALGAGSVTVTQTNAFGCDTTVTLPVTITTIPVAAIVGPTTVCELSPESYSSAVNAGAIYTWTVAGGNITSGQGTNAIGVDWGLAGAGTITLNVALASGCDTTVSVNITINPKPTPVIAGSTSVCAFTAEAYSTPAVAGHTYSWSVGGGAITAGQGTNGITVQWGAAGAGTVTVTQTSGAGCDSTVTLPVTINPTPQPVISGPVAVCEFTSGNAYSTPAVAGHTYLWAVTGGSISSGQGTNAISVFWNAAGAGTVTLTQTSAAGCDTTISINVTIDPKPNPVIAGPLTVCQYDVDNYSVTAVAGDTYNWSVSGGSISGGQGTNNVTVQWGAAGAGTVSVTQTTPAGCDTTVTVNVTINPKPLPVIAGPATVCQFEPATYSVPVVAGNTYNWSVSGGVISGGQGTSSINVNWGALGAGSVTVTQTNAFGCDTTVTLPVTITTIPVAAIVGPTTVCELSPESYSSAANVGAIYTWAVTGGNIASGQGTTAINVNWGLAGAGTITLNVALPSGCDTTVSVNVTINPKPTPVIAGSTNVCAFTSEAYSTPAVAGHSYSWSVSGGSIASGQGTNSISVNWAAAGAGTVTVTQTNGFGCDSTVSVPVTINPTPQPVISGPTTLCEYTGSNVYSTPAVAGHTYLWSVSGGNITAGAGTNSITVYWGAQGSGTVTLTQTASAGAASCDTTVSINITIDPKPNPVLSGPTTVCQYDVDTYSVTAVPGDSYNWVITGGSVSAGQGTASATVQWGAAGIGQVSVTQTNPSGCDTTISINVNINPKPLPVITGPAQPCAWTSGTYSVVAVAGNTYSWSVSGGNISSGQNTNSINVNWLAATTTGTVTVTQTTAAGCDTTVTLNVTVNPRPVAEIIGPDTVCERTIGVAYSTAANAGATYAWTVVGGQVGSGQGTNNVTINWSAAGVGSISLLVTMPTGCDTTVGMTVTLLPKPTPVITGVSNVCAFTPQGYSTPAVAGHTYSWSVSGGTISSGQGTNSINVNWAAAGAGSVTITQTTAAGCDSSITLPVTINPTPQPVISGPVSICEFTGGNIYSTPAAAGHTYLWSVSGGNITAGAGTNSITVYWGAQGSGSVTLTQTAPPGAASCDTTVSINVTINPKPNPVITGPSPVCALSTQHIYSVPAVGGDTYQWTVAGGQIASGQGSNAIQVTWGASGTGTVSVEQTNPFGCDTTVSISVTILPQPTPVISGASPVCAYQENIVYSTPFVAGNSYNWSVVGGNISSGQGTNSINVAWSGTPGTGTITLTETHPLGCDSTVVLQVTLLPAPTPMITGDNEICGYSTGNYQSNIDPSATITWNVTGDGLISSGQGTNNISVDWGAPGTGIVSVTYAYANGCDSTVSYPVNILNAPIPILIGQDTACQRALITYETPYVAGVTYTWTPVGGTVVSGQGYSSAVIQWFAFGDNTLTLYAVSTAGCDTTLTMNVHILYAPVPQIRPEEQTICRPGLVTWDGTHSVDEIGYDWDLGNGGSSTAGIVTSGYWFPGDYTVELVTPGPYGCPDTAYALLHVLPGPHAEFSILPGYEFVQDYDTALFVNSSTQYTSYLWNFGDGSTDTTFSPNHFYDLPGEYEVTLWVTDSLGCVDSTTHTLTVTWDLNLFVPTAFTPNGDGLNDFFNVVTKNVTDFHLLIFSRWGELLFETEDPNFQWAGDYHGEPMQEGAYVWKIEATLLGGTKTTKAGTVTLMR